MILNLALSGRNKTTILQLMAYHMIPRDAAWHGREFTKLYYDLVKRFIGPEAALQLRTAYSENKIKYRAKKQLSPEALVKLRKNAELMRERQGDAVLERMEDDYRV
jgi:hypothetical protein